MGAILMGVTFILGRAGSGKTRKCLDDIRQELISDPEGPPLIFLVPEQATFQMEQELVRTPGLSCIARAQVLSFRRLAWRVFQQAGGAARPHISDLGKRMIIRSTLLENKQRLRLFSGLSGEFGICQKISSSISECKAYDIGSEQLQGQAQLLDDQGQQPLLAAKLHDLALVYQGLEQALANRYTDPDDYMRLAAERISQASIVKDAIIWVDGFSGFTTEEYLMLAQLIGAAAEVRVALCMPGGTANIKLEDTDLFYPVWKTYHQLVNLTADSGVMVEANISLDERNHRANNPWLSHLEGQLDCWPSQPMAGQPRGLRLVSAANRRAEVEAVARQMVRLSRHRGYRWREMSVMCRSVENYADLVRTVFADYNIPLFVDRRQGVGHHPLVELLRSGLEIAASNWRHQSVFRCLKTDLTPFSRQQVDLMENYCLACGIEGSAWSGGKPWSYVLDPDIEDSDDNSGQDYLMEINRLREMVLDCLKPLTQLAGGCHRVTDICVAVWQFFEQLSASETLGRWQQQDEAQGRLAAAQEHRQVWDLIVDLLDQIVEIMGEEHLSTREFLTVVEAGLEQLKVGLIPPGLDQVLVGSIDRSRNPNIKALFFLGLNEGNFPLQRSEEQIFGDDDREYLAAAKLQLAPTVRQQLLEEQYLVYIALTRASDFLYLSYPLANEEGKELRPSSVLRRVSRIFPDIITDYLAMEPENDEQLQEFLVPGPSSFSLLINAIRRLGKGEQPPAPLRQLYRLYFQQTAPLFGSLLASLQFSPAEQRLPSELVELHFPNPLKLSVSRLEQYARCPFSYFVQHVLQLKESRRVSLDPLNLGRIYHQVLAEFVSDMQHQGLNWGTISIERQQQLLDDSLQGIAGRLEQAGLLRTAREQHLLGQVRQDIYYAAEILREHAERGNFKVHKVEIAFAEDGELPPVVVKLDDQHQIMLRGRVDRIDLVGEAGRQYVRVVDYKTRETKFYWGEFYHGLQLQLLTYLWAVSQGEVGAELEVAGAMYFPVSRPLVTAQGPLNEAMAKVKCKRQNKMQGIILRDTDLVKMLGEDRSGWSEILPVRLKEDGSFVAGKSNSTAIDQEQLGQAISYTQKMIKRLGKDILAGKVDVAPIRYKKQSPCTYCGYKSVCWFDTGFNGCGYNFLASMDDDTVLDNIRRHSERGDI